ncbi:hypothetical protein [Streptomyces aurantiogriseus]|uniref:Uncharacterized protein n=1 Tax=Streptomyces aurantiogriseus TaxID=66870 RepID=A0A918FD37_9ACTN|nr:hypothetical protein [Streptomyces aurantiogriseus]GGR24022.1 hypothetical protein GCM10010251_45120 [Streptomyces aurantiogriseus]
MTRLTPESVEAEEVREVLTDQELSAHARLIWAYLTVADRPQNSNSLAAELGFAASTVSKHIGPLREKRLIRRLNGVWIAESPAEEA